MRGFSGHGAQPAIASWRGDVCPGTARAKRGSASGDSRACAPDTRGRMRDIAVPHRPWCPGHVCPDPGAALPHRQLRRGRPPLPQPTRVGCAYQYANNARAARPPRGRAFVLSAPAGAGGLSRLASSHSVLKEIERTAPELGALLRGPWCWDRKDEVPEGKLPWYVRAQPRPGGRGGHARRDHLASLSCNAL